MPLSLSTSHYIHLSLLLLVLFLSGCGKYHKNAHFLQVEPVSHYHRPVVQAGEQIELQANITGQKKGEMIEVAWFHGEKPLCSWREIDHKGMSRCEFTVQQEHLFLNIEARKKHNKHESTGIQLQLKVLSDLQAINTE